MGCSTGRIIMLLNAQNQQHHVHVQQEKHKNFVPFVLLSCKSFRRQLNQSESVFCANVCESFGVGLYKHRKWHLATLVINFQEMFFTNVTYIFSEFEMERNNTQEYPIAEKEDLIRRFYCVCLKVFASKSKSKKSFDWAGFCHLFCLCLFVAVFRKCCRVNIP